MSFFLGKKSDGSDLMVATKDTKTISQLKAIDPINCEFHSSLPYLTYKKFDAVVRDYGYVTHTTGYLFSFYSGPTYSVVTAEFPEEFYTNYVDRQLIVIIDGEMSLSHFTTEYGIKSKLEIGIKFGQKWVAREPIYPDTNYPKQEPVNLPSALNRYLLVPKRAVNPANQEYDDPYTVPEVSILVTNFTTTGQYISPIDPNNTTGILVNNSSFILNGYDLFSLNYISNASLSSADIAIATESSTFYMVGEEDTAVGMQLLSAPGRTRLYKGNTVLFDTLYGRRGHIYAGLRTYTTNAPCVYSYENEYYGLLIQSANISATESTPMNIIVSALITASNITYNNSAIGNFSGISYIAGAKCYGAMSFCIDDNLDYAIGHDEYTYLYDATTVTTFMFIRVYVYRVVEDGRVKLYFRIRTNPEYTNAGATISVAFKAIMFV